MKKQIKITPNSRWPKKRLYTHERQTTVTEALTIHDPELARMFESVAPTIGS